MQPHAQSATASIVVVQGGEPTPPELVRFCPLDVEKLGKCHFLKPCTAASVGGAA